MTHVRASASFYRLAAVCSLLSAATTLVLIFGSGLYASPAGFEEAVALRDNSAYMFRLWVYLLHPFLVFTAALAIAIHKFRDAGGSVSLGLAAFFTWALCEAVQQGFTIAALNHAWRSGYATATDESTRTAYQTLILGHSGIWDAFYLVLLTAFLLANAAYGVATWKGRGMERVVSTAFWAAAVLTLGTWLENFAGATALSKVTGWMYPLVQPAARVLFGVWLWQIARAQMASPQRAEMYA